MSSTQSASIFALRTSALMALLCGTYTPLLAGNTVPLPFGTDISLWRHHSFVGTTNYQAISLEEGNFVQASSRHSASGLIKEITINLEQTPVLNWQWKIDATLGNIDELSKSGDDFAARVYVIEKSGLLPWSSRALNYVWSSNQPKDSHWISPYTDNSRLIAVRSGDEHSGQLIMESRNVREDFKAIYGEEIKQVHVVAIMTDTDNTRSEARAIYGNLYFSSQPVELDLPLTPSSDQPPGE